MEKNLQLNKNKSKFRYIKYILLTLLACVFVVVQVLADLELPAYLEVIINDGIVRGDTDLIWQNGAEMILVSLIGIVAAIIVSYIAAVVAAGVSKDVRSDVFQRIESYSLTEFDKFSTASLITRNTNDVTQLTMLIFILIRMAVSAPVMAVGGIIRALETSREISWILVIAIPSTLIIIGTLMGILAPKFSLLQKLVDRINLVSRQTLTGVRVIRAFRKEETEERRFDETNTDIKKVNTFLLKCLVLISPLVFLILDLTQLSIVWFGAQAVSLGEIEVGSVMAFINYAMQVMFSFLMVSMVALNIPRAFASWKRIKEVLFTKSIINDKENTVEFDKNTEISLEYKNVSFRYPGADENVLSNISFTAKKGETIAIIGGTGSGKSTMINLLPRFYDVTEGEILVNNVDIRDYKQLDLHEAIGYVSQKAVLFSGTIESNIKLGKLDATEEELIKAAEISQSMDFINKKEDKFQSEISQGGANVSGGQKQRISIARALIRQGKIYIFDDSFSALDYKTDRALRKELSIYTKDAINLIVAQRVSSIMDADKILVLEDGVIVGEGTHKELLANNEIYREIASTQLSKEELENVR